MVSIRKIGSLYKKGVTGLLQKEFGAKWQKRFSEDLPEILRSLGYQSINKVALQLSKDGLTKTYVGIFTTENRKNVVLYNRSAAVSSNPEIPRKLTVNEAIDDLKQFDELLKTVSSYSQLSEFDYTSAIRKIADAITAENREVEVNKLTNDIAKVMAEIGDRHASVKNELLETKTFSTYNQRLPFALATLNGQIVGLKRNVNGQTYRYYNEIHPYVQSINGVTTETLVNIFNYRDKKAPSQAKLSRGSSAMEKYGKLVFENNLECPESVDIVFSNGNNQRKETVQLTLENKSYTSKLVEEQNLNGQQISKNNFDGLSKIVGDQIGYINIPEMYNYDDVDGLENAIKNTFKNFAKTKALIIDIRNNPGGAREILQTFAGYLVQATQSPWVANIAYLRKDKAILGDEESMSARYLYSYNSKNFSDPDRAAIDQFNKQLKLQYRVDPSKFSSPFYMILHHGGVQTYHQPVYILVNEGSFSAASVFASAFKGLPNVKIVGETTDGSSGNSKTLYLKNSNIKINISTMLSFQRNGKTLDGNGTTPDIAIPADENQVLNGYDSQLNKLIKMINGNR